MKQIDWKRLFKRRTLGLAIMAMGLVVLLMPVFVGAWVLGLLGIALVITGLFQFVETIRSADKTDYRIAYFAGVMTTLLGLVFFFSPALALSGLLAGASLFLIADGAYKI